MAELKDENCFLFKITTLMHNKWKEEQLETWALDKVIKPSQR